MKIELKLELKGVDLARYRQLKRERKSLFGMLPITEASSTSEVKIHKSHLTPRQRKKFEEIALEGFD